MTTLAGKVALATDAGSGLGRGSALALARAGAAVVCNDVRTEGKVETMAAIGGAGGECAAAIGEARKDNIRTVAVSPGTIDIPMLTRDLADMNTADAEGFLQSVRDANTLGPIGTAGEIGEAIVVLASPAASYITEANVVVDGDFTAIKRF